MQTHLIFDWGDTLMVDYKDQPGPMARWPHVEWVDGAKEAMEKLFKKYPCYIGSNSGYSNAQLLKEAFDRVNGAHFFRKIFASKEIGFEKPDVRFFQYILNDLGINPENAAIIGNDYTKDICGAKDAGIFTIFLSEKISPKDFSKADIIIDSMKKLPSAIEKL